MTSSWTLASSLQPATTTTSSNIRAARDQNDFLALSDGSPLVSLAAGTSYTQVRVVSRQHPIVHLGCIVSQGISPDRQKMFKIIFWRVFLAVDQVHAYLQVYRVVGTSQTSFEATTEEPKR